MTLRERYVFERDEKLSSFQLVFLSSHPADKSALSECAR